MRVAILARPTRVRCIVGVVAVLMCRRRWPRAHGTVNQPETLELLAYSRIGLNNVASSIVKSPHIAFGACGMPRRNGPGRIRRWRAPGHTDGR